MNFFYLQRSREEYERAVIVYKKINPLNVKNFFTHLLKSMEFLSDGLLGERTDMFNIELLNDSVVKITGSDFLDFYFYLYNLVRKDFNFISPNNIIIVGRNNNLKISTNDFHDYLFKVRDYFNRAYTYLEK